MVCLFNSWISLFALAAAVPVEQATPAPQSNNGQLRLIPGPTGQYKVGTTSMTLVDENRTEKYATYPNSQRRVVIELFYPACESASGNTGPYAPPQTLRTIETANMLPPNILDKLVTNSYPDAEVVEDQHRRKTIIFSPGLGSLRMFHTAQLEDLASHGFIVVAIDHPYDSEIVEFPNVSPPLPPVYSKADNATLEETCEFLKTRIEDVVFVSKYLSKLPEKLSKRMDLSPHSIGIFGHSLGGVTAAGAMYAAPETFAAGINLDGTFISTTAKGDVKKPFLLMGAPESSPTDTKSVSWKEFESQQTGWKLELSLEGFKQETFTDKPMIVKMLGFEDLFKPGEQVELLGSVEPVRSAVIQRAYILEFFNWMGEGQTPNLLKKVSKDYPEVEFVR
jgi:predicted dienelactone hydrolase